VGRALIVCGTSGAGKSSVAAQICQLLTRAGASSAFIDADTLAQFGPAPWGHQQGVSFYDMLKCKNVGSLWPNFRDAGARHVVLAAHVDSLQLREQYERALEGCVLQMALLIAPPGRLMQHLTGRQRDPFHHVTHAEDGMVRQEVVERLAEEQVRLQTAGVHDFAVVNDASPDQTAVRVLELAGWLSVPDSPETGR
jgi:ABC-type dipeptide/oligopeptide/nickel transport system ATPase component